MVKTFNYQNLSWIDIGCGTGKMGNVVFEKFAPTRFVFCDCSEKMVEIAKERFQEKTAEFVVCDVQELEYANEFDVITVIQVNHYLRKRQRSMAVKKCMN